MKEMNVKWKRIGRVVLCVILALCLLSGVAMLLINHHVKVFGKSRVLTPEQAAQLSNVDCIIVLGCQVRSDGSLSDMLNDRLTQGVALYHAGVAPKMIMSGDHGRANYDEVNAMKGFAIDNDVPSEDVFMDHAGFSTYETMYRAKEIFGAQNVVIVTQEYHLYRAIYIAEELGLEAHGVSADLRTYRGQLKRDVREVLARCKDFAMCLFKPEPTFLGEAIPVSGNGDLTNDQ